MKTKKARRGVLALIAFIALVLAGYLLPPLAIEEEKPRRRIQGVNNAAPVIGANLNTNPAPAVPIKK